MELEEIIERLCKDAELTLCIDDRSTSHRVEFKNSLRPVGFYSPVPDLEGNLDTQRLQCVSEIWVDRVCIFRESRVTGGESLENTERLTTIALLCKIFNHGLLGVYESSVKRVNGGKFT